MLEPIEIVQSQNWQWSWDLVIKAIGLLTIIATFISTFIGVRKYMFEKNRDIYIRRLNEVYAPLYSFLVKQEQLRKIRFSNYSREEYPIFSMTRVIVKKKTKFGRGNPTINEEKTEEPIEIVNRDNFWRVLNETNKGLVNPNLLLLINRYEILIYLEETNTHDDAWHKASSEKVKVEKELIYEIILGYEKLVKKLSLDNRGALKKNRDFFYIQKPTQLKSTAEEENTIRAE